jgi:ribosome recycling factor
MQHARAAQKKVLRAIELGRKVRPDDLKKAGVKMEKVIEKATAEVKGIVDGARRALERV